jgi:hypothetical protein
MCNYVVQDSNCQPDGGFSSEKRLLPDRVAANVKEQANLFLHRSLYNLKKPEVLVDPLSYTSSENSSLTVNLS